MGLRLAESREEGSLESVVLVVVRRSGENRFHLTSGTVVQGGDNVIELGLVYGDSFGAELRFDASEPHLWLVGPELGEFE